MSRWRLDLLEAGPVIAHNPMSTPLFVPVEIGPQRRQIVAALDRVARLDLPQWQGLQGASGSFYTVPAVSGLQVTPAREAVGRALELTGREDARAKISRYAQELVEGVAHVIALELVPPRSPLREVMLPPLVTGVREQLTVTVEATLSSLAARDLVSTRGFTQAHYDLLTGPWRCVLGPIHREDHGAPRSPRPPMSALEPRVLKDLGPQGPHVQALLHAVPELTYEQVQALSEARDRLGAPEMTDTIMVVTSISDPVRNQAFKGATFQARDLCGARANTLLPRYEADAQWRPKLPEALQYVGKSSELNTMIFRPVFHAMAGLMFRERMTLGDKVSQLDYDRATSAWRAAIGPVHPDDAPFDQEMLWR